MASWSHFSRKQLYACLTILIAVQFTNLSPTNCEVSGPAPAPAPLLESDDDGTELEFSQEQLVALEQFRPLVAKYLTTDYMKSNHYLITWLKARSYDVKEATRMLMKALDWRKANFFDGPVKEDFSSWDKKFLHNLDGVDKYGHPIMIAALGRWNPRQFILAGPAQAEKYSRFLARTLFELPYQKALELWEKNGKVGPSQYVSVFDLHGFNIRQHFCLSCIPSYRDIVRVHQEYYPFATNRTIIINAPTAFETLMQSLRPVLSIGRARDLQIYGYDKNQWRAALLQTINPNQLPPQYGGSAAVIRVK